MKILPLAEVCASFHFTTKLFLILSKIKNCPIKLKLPQNLLIYVSIFSAFTASVLSLIAASYSIFLKGTNKFPSNGRRN